MTFDEKLDRARTGSRAAYESLCLGTLDRLYTAALIALKDEKTARGVVISAINDGYAGISRIKDERHLSSWLAHELTKNAVDKLKELRSGGVAHTASGVFADTGKLPDVDRLVFAVYVSFGYGAREISVLTGMSEDTVNYKLASAKNRLGPSYDGICTDAASFTAPASLRDRYTGFDQSAARLGQAQPAQEPASPEPPPETVKQEVPQPVQPDIAAESEQTSEKSDDAAAEPVPEEAPKVVADAPSSSESSAETDISDVPDDGDEAVFSEDGDEYDGEDDETEEAEAEEPDGDAGYEEETAFPNESERKDERLAGMALNAETFIAVVSAEKMKGSEFLRLIGNTRISNSAYREIEQNPRLTKKRLIELLEQSPLTENDYYKLLTAVKDRREVLDMKEENRLAHERAGLYDGSRREKYRRRRREKPKTELEMAIGLSEKKHAQPLVFEKPVMPEDDTDYQLQNAEGSFSQARLENERRENSLEAAVAATRRQDVRKDPMSHSSLHDLFDDRNEEPIDPFAAIAAHETGEQAKPDRIDEQRNEWLLGKHEDKPDEQEKHDNSATVEFSAEPAAVSDTKPFAAIDPEMSWDSAEEKADDASDKTETTDASDDGNEAPVKPEPPVPEVSPTAAVPLGYDPFAVSGVNDDEPEITTLPIQDGISVTQIIREHAPAASVNDISTVPVGSDLSVTQIISDYSVHEDAPYVPDVTGMTAEDEEPAESSGADLAAKPEEPEQLPPPEEKSGQGYSPDIGLVFGSSDDEDDEGEDDDTDEGKLSFGSGKTEKPEPRSEAHHAPEPRVEPPASMPEDDIYDDEDDDFDRSPRRKHYKGNEYFIDDNEYYEGVNRGKIAACAVFAVLLTAGSAGMKFMNGEQPHSPTINDTAITSETEETSVPPVQEDSFSSETELKKLGSYSDMTADIYEGSASGEPFAAYTGYLRASSEPYPTDIMKEWSQCGAVFSDDTAFIYSDASGAFRAVSISDAADDTEDGTDTDTDMSVEESGGNAEEALHIERSSLHSFTSIDGDLYIVCDRINDDGTADANVTEVLVYDKKLSKKDEYSLSGTYAGSGICGGKLAVAACFCPDTVNDPPYYEAGGTLHEIPADEIYAIDGAKHNAVHILYSVGGEALAVLGGYSDVIASGEHVRFGDDGMTLAAPDGGVTYAVDITADMKIKSACAYKGDAFGADCIGEGGMIGQMMLDEGMAVTVFKNGKLLTVPDESAVSSAWSDSGTAYIVTERKDGQRMLYGFDMSGDTPVSAEIAASDIYTDKLIKAGERLAGVKAEPSPDGERAGLRLSLYEYNGSLTETAYSIIELDKETPRENLKYLSSPAEQDAAMLAVNSDGTLFAVPTVYFDGYSEVERVVLLEFDGTIFSQVGEYITYDEKSSVLCPVFRNSLLYIITDHSVGKVER